MNAAARARSGAEGRKRPFQSEARLFRPGHAAQFLGIAKTAFYELRKQPGFPKPRLVGNSLVPMYSREDLEAWVRALPAEPEERVTA